jgi:hypothetical protein
MILLLYESTNPEYEGSMFLKMSVVNNSAVQPNKTEELNPPAYSNLSSDGVSRILGSTKFQ